MDWLHHLGFSVAANAAVLACLVLLRRAPPRLVVYVCLAGMLMATVPWTMMAEWVSLAGVQPASLGLTGAPAAAAALSTEVPMTESPSWAIAFGWLWLTVAAVWMCVTFYRSLQQRRRWRRDAVAAGDLADLALERFRRLAVRVQIRRLPGAHLAMATGLVRREIWLGDGIAEGRHLAIALNHELCHLAAGDHHVVHVISVVERLLWWNPLTWILGSIARRHLEYACDQRCKEYLGARSYRRTLAEIALHRIPRNPSPGLGLGDSTGVINRMKRLDTTPRTRAGHVAALLLTAAGLSFASTTLAEAPPALTLKDCSDRLPDGVHYRLVIHTDVNTRGSKPEGEMAISLQDLDEPESRDVPEGSGPYIRCVMDMIGAADEPLPEGA